MRIRWGHGGCPEDDPPQVYLFDHLSAAVLRRKHVPVFETLAAPEIAPFLPHLFILDASRLTGV